jgi:hypothetical protein
MKLRLRTPGRKTRHGLAHIERAPNGEYRYVCECHPIEGGWSMAEFFASIETGRPPQRLIGDELLHWQTRLLREAGVLQDQPGAP